MKRIAVALLVVVVFGGAVWIALRPRPVSVDAASVTRGSLVVTLDEEGRTRVRERYIVLAPLDGLLHRIDLEPGDAVQGGTTVLATVEPLSPSLLDARSIAQADARVEAARAAVARAREARITAAGLLDAARDDLARQQRAGSAVSAQALADARREVLFREGEVAATTAAVEVSLSEQAVAEAALLAARPASSGASSTGGIDGSPPGDQRAAPETGALVVQAPIDGTVLQVLRESEGPVRIGEPLVELGDTARLEIVADYLTTEAVRIEPGMEAIVQGWGGEALLAARVRRVEPAGRTKVSSLGVEEQRVDVLLDLVESRASSGPLADGFRVEVRIVTWRGEDLVLVPEAALVRQGDGWIVFRREGGRVAAVEIEVGHRDGRSAEVLSGLGTGDEVVIYPSDRVLDGVRIEVR